MLVAALVGPFFINWTDYRSTFETYAERVLGHRVTVLGEADLRLLPAPSISFSDVRVGEAEDPLMVVSRFNMRVELSPLLKGEIRVLDMELERPHLSLSLDETGRVDWLTAMTSQGALADMRPEDVVFDQVRVRDGALAIVDARSGETHQIDAANLLISARSMAGPFKLDGSLTIDEAPYSIRLATGRGSSDAGLRIKGEVTPGDVPVNLAFDGSLSHDDAAPGFEGMFKVASVEVDSATDSAWSAEGSFKADISEVAIDQFDFRFGPEDRHLGMTGSADLVYSGDKRFEIRATTKQIDLDRLLGGGPQKPVAISGAGQSLIAALGAVPLPKIDGVVSFDVPAVVVGGGIVQNVRLDLETMLGGWRIARLAGRVPGRTVIATQGDLGLVPDLTYRGVVSIDSEQPAAFLGWWRQTDESATALDAASIEGRLNLQPSGAALDNVRMTIGGSEARGAMAYRVPRSGNPIFSMSLDADRLDLDQVEGLAAFMQTSEGTESKNAASAPLDVSLRVRARQVSARGVEGEGLVLEAEYAEGGLRIDRLYAADLAGATVDVNGRVTNLLSAPQGSLKGKLDARDLSGLVAIAKGLMPGSPTVDRLERAAAALVPAQFDGELQASALGDGTDLRIDLVGEAGGTHTTAAAALKGRVDDWYKANLDLSISMAGPNSVLLMQQFGLDVLPVDDLGAGELSVSAKGVPAEGLDVFLGASSDGAQVTASGTVTLERDAEALYSLSVNASADDLVPIALLSGKVLPVMSGTIAASTAFDVTGKGTELKVDIFDSNLADTRFKGQVSGDLVPAPGELYRRFSGALELNAIDLRGLTEAVLGPDQWFSVGDGSSVWPTTAFGAPLMERTDLTLALKADRLVVDEENAISGMRGELRLTPLMLRLDGVEGAYGGGSLEGAMTLRRSEAEGAVSARVKLTNADLRQMVWQRDGRAVATGSMDLFLELEGAGRTISAIVAGLAGGGTFTIEKGEFRGINPQAFPLVIRAVDAGLDLRDEAIRDVFQSHMEAGSLPFDKVEGTLTAIGGRLSGRNVVVDSTRAEVFGSAEINLDSYEIDADFSLKVDPGENAVTGAEPQVGLLFRGPVDAPVRSVDIAPFSAFLTLRAFEQEVERVEKLQAEIMERDRLLRELKRQKQERLMRAREAEEAAARAAEEAATEELPGAATTDPQLPADGANAAPEQTDGNAGFADRIRTVINRQPAGQADAGSGSLPPLDPPVSVEDLITREIGIPAAIASPAGKPLVLPGVPGQ